MSIDKNGYNSGSIATTGTNNQTTKDVQCNVYDMASNVFEWSTETYKDPPEIYWVYRGGTCYNSNNYLNYRNKISTSYSPDGVGFRPLLYV